MKLSQPRRAASGCQTGDGASFQTDSADTAEYDGNAEVESSGHSLHGWGSWDCRSPEGPQCSIGGADENKNFRFFCFFLVLSSSFTWDEAFHVGEHLGLDEAGGVERRDADGKRWPHRVDEGVEGRLWLGIKQDIIRSLKSYRLIYVNRWPCQQRRALIVTSVMRDVSGCFFLLDWIGAGLPKCNPFYRSMLDQQ